jgi:hypothetical protein
MCDGETEIVLFRSILPRTEYLSVVFLNPDHDGGSPKCALYEV